MSASTNLGVSSGYAVDTPQPVDVAYETFGAPVAAGATSSPAPTTVAYGGGADRNAVDAYDLDDYGADAPLDATGAGRSRASSFYDPVSGETEEDPGDVASQNVDERHAALDRSRLAKQARLRDMLRNMNESLDVAMAASDI